MRKKKFDETNDVSFSVETTEFGTREKRKKEKKVLSPEEKKKRTIKALIITASVVLVLAIFFGGCAISSAVGTKSLIKQGQSFDKVEYTEEHKQIVPTFDKELGYYVFENKDGREFKVLQFTDVHIGGGAFSHKKDAWAMNAVATMIQKEKPDFVVVTGDIAYPVPFQSGTFNNKNATMIFAEMMETLGVYWTFAFGNHDTEYYSRYSRVDICNYYKERNFKYCLFDAGVCDDKDYIGDDAMGFGNNMFVVKNPDGSINQALVTFDSHSYIDGDYFGAAWKYDNIHQCQVDWYTREMAKLRKANGNKAVNNLVFFHIPLREYRDAWSNFIEKKEAEEKLGNKNYKPTKGETLTNDRGTTEFIYGTMGETDKTKNGQRTYGVFCGMRTDELFEAGLENDMQGVFCGHDHYNNFSVNYTPKGATRSIRLTYGMSIDYLAYVSVRDHAQRGCTQILLKADNSFKCAPKNYYKDYNVTPEKPERKK